MFNAQKSGHFVFTKASEKKTERLKKEKRESSGKEKETIIGGVRKIHTKMDYRKEIIRENG